MMNLTCTENFTSTVHYAKADPVIFQDPRVLANLLQEESRYIPPMNYFQEIQSDVQPYMRKAVTTWMLEICEEQMCEEQVLPLAVNLMDRFLCVCDIKKQYLQLLGATCLLIASKVRTTTYLTIDLLCAYTDHSVTSTQIAKWELLVLSKLQWNISAVTGFDYVDQVIERCSWGKESHLLRRHAHTLVSICYTDPAFIQTPPSVIAAGCIFSAVRGLKLPSQELAKIEMSNMLRVDPGALDMVVCLVDQIVETSSKSSLQNTIGKSQTCDSPTYSQPETPTEVENVYF